MGMPGAPALKKCVVSLRLACGLTPQVAGTAGGMHASAGRGWNLHGPCQNVVQRLGSARSTAVGAYDGRSCVAPPARMMQPTRFRHCARLCMSMRMRILS